MIDVESNTPASADLRYSRAMLVALSRSPLITIPEGMPAVESYMTKPEPREEKEALKPRADKLLLAPAKQTFPSSQVSSGPREDEPTTPGSKPPAHRSLTSPTARKSEITERGGDSTNTRGTSAGRGGGANGALSVSRAGGTTPGSRDKEGTSVPRVTGARLVDRPGQTRTGSTNSTTSAPGGIAAWGSVRVPPPTTSVDGITKLGSIKVLSTTTTPKSAAGSRNANWRGDDIESGRDKLSRSAPDRDSNDRRRGKDNMPEWMNDDLVSPKDGTRPTEDLFQQFKAKRKELDREKSDKSEKGSSATSSNEKNGGTARTPEKKQARSTSQPKDGGNSPTKPTEVSTSASVETGKPPVAIEASRANVENSDAPPATPNAESERSSVAASSERTSGGGRGSRFQRFFGGEDGEEPGASTPITENGLPTVRGVYEGGPTTTPLAPARQVVTSPGKPLTEQELIASLVGNGRRGSPSANGPVPANAIPHPPHGQSIDILALLGSGPARSQGGDQSGGLGERNLRGSAPVSSSQQMLSEEEVLRRLNANAAARKTPKMSEMPIERSPQVEERQEMERIMALLAKNTPTGAGFPNELPPGFPMIRDPNRGSFSQFSMQQGMVNPLYSPPPSSAQMPPQMTPNRMLFQSDPHYHGQMKGVPPGGLNGSGGMPMPKNTRQVPRGEPLFSSHIQRQQQAQQFDDPLAAMVQNNINAKKTHLHGPPMGPTAGDIQSMIKQGLLNPADLQNGLMFPPPGSLEPHRFEPNGPGGLPPLSGLPPNHPMLSNDPVAFAAFAAAASQGMPGGGGLPPHMMQGPAPPPGFFNGNGMPPPPNHMGPPHMGPPPPGFFNPSMFGMPPNQVGGPPPHLFGGRGSR
ncbi:hypothetical protein BJ742DRAFT_779626 [Cladochytrium replicatum]|nr:hypothetical protein BJ742DRAFT_779626 [Cladochytrium replicatum]